MPGTLALAFLGIGTAVYGTVVVGGGMAVGVHAGSALDAAYRATFER